MVISGTSESDCVWIKKGDRIDTCPRGCNWYISIAFNWAFELEYDRKDTVGICPLDSTGYLDSGLVYDRDDAIGIFALDSIRGLIFFMSKRME
jgi:hypothetical protein